MNNFKFQQGYPVIPCCLLWHPGSEQPVYLALPAQRSSLLATHNSLVQKTTALLMLAEKYVRYYISSEANRHTRCG